MGHYNESTVLSVMNRYPDDDVEYYTGLADLNHIYLYRVFRNEFKEDDGYTPGVINVSELIYPDTMTPVHFVGKSNGVRLTDFTRINPNEGEIDISAGGRLTIWYAKPNAAKAMATFRGYYIEKRDTLLRKVEKYDELIDNLYPIGT